MVTREEIEQKTFRKYNGNEACRVSKEEMLRFCENNKRLTEMVGDKKMEFEETCLTGYGSYEKLAEACELSVATLKRTVAGGIKVTRTFLYKLAVGTKMSLEEANEYFALCGGVLREDDLEDYICMKALEDGDSIELYVSQYKEYTKFQGKPGK